MEQREPFFTLIIWKLVIELGQLQWKISIGYEGSRQWPDRYFFFTAGWLYVRLWVTGETR